MNISEFIESLESQTSPEGLSYELRALWYEAKGDWEQAHQLVQDDQKGNGAWVHAYLHRKEGDEWNAGYWYRKAGKPFPSVSLNEEWKEIVRELLQIES